MSICRNSIAPSHQHAKYPNSDPYSDVAVAADGSVYVADPHNDRIQKFSPRSQLLMHGGRITNQDVQTPSHIILS